MKNELSIFEESNVLEAKLFCAVFVQGRIGCIIQIVLYQFVIKLIQICYIQVCYIHLIVKLDT